MSKSSRPPPKRIETDPTIAVDRERILSASARAEIERAASLLLEEEREAMRRVKQERTTLVPCPACAACPFCRNAEGEAQHMVTPLRAAEYEAP